jgi:hypothetical protein
VETQPNSIVEANCDVAKKTRDNAPNYEAHAQGIIVSGQLALHHWIGAFGSLAMYVKAVSLTQLANN